MDSQVIIETLQRDVKDKTILVRFYNLKNGTDIWIDGLCWRLYDYNMKDYFHEEFGIEIEGAMNFDVMDTNDEMVRRHCFNSNNLFSITNHDNLNFALNEVSGEVINAAVDMGIPLDKINADIYRGEWKDFTAFATNLFNELELPELPERYREWIDYEKYAESLEQQYYFCNGHVFDATYR